MFELIARIGDDYFIQIEGEATARKLTRHEYRVLGCHVNEFIRINPAHTPMTADEREATRWLV